VKSNLAFTTTKISPVSEVAEQLLAPLPMTERSKERQLGSDNAPVTSKSASRMQNVPTMDSFADMLDDAIPDKKDYSSNPFRTN